MMKKGLIFVIGVITGGFLTILVALLIGKSSNNGVTLFETEGECLSENSFRVFQAIDAGMALAREIKEESYTSLSNELLVLFLKESEPFYDNQIIHIPAGQCAKQVGVYKYQTKSGIEKTVPIVTLRNK